MRSAWMAYMGLATVFTIIMPQAAQGATAAQCTDAKKKVKDLSSFNDCLNICLTVNNTANISDTVQCLPDKCSITLTMSPQSAQAACTLAGCQLPRVILDCPPAKGANGKRFQPSYLLCPMDSKSGNQFGIDGLEVGEDTAAAGSRMNMADIPVPPNAKYTQPTLKAILNDQNNSKGCNSGSCHGTNNPLGDPKEVFATRHEPLAPYVIDETNPNTQKKVKAAIDAVAKNQAQFKLPYLGSNGKALTPQKLGDICACVKANNNKQTIVDQAKDPKNLPKSQDQGFGQQVASPDASPNPNVNADVLLNLCTNLSSYQTTRSCGKDAPPPGSAMACLGVMGGGKFLSSTGAVSTLTLDVSGNAVTTAITTSVNAFSFTNIESGVNAFNYLTRTLIQSVILDSLAGTASDNGDLTMTGTGVALVNGATANIRLDAASLGGFITFQISDASSGMFLAGGTGETGLAALQLNSGGP